MTDSAIASRTVLSSCLRLRRDATLEEAPGRPGSLLLTHGGRSAQITGLSPGRHTALMALADGPVTELELTRLVSARDGESGLLGWQMLVRRLDSAGTLEHGLRTDGRLLASLLPIGTGPLVRRPPPAPTEIVKLSRFVTIRAAEGRLLAQSPRSHLGVELSAELSCVLGVLASWRRPCDVADELAALGEPVVSATIGLIADAGLLTVGGPAGDPETSDASLAQWSVTDLWLHARSRGPRLGTGYGGTYPLADRFPALSAVPAETGGARVDLPRPDLAAVRQADASFTEVLERRRSTREHDAADPITVGQLGELLYRSARTTAVYTHENVEVSTRPYPSGGSLHELEIYAAVSSCTGLEPGLWHYSTSQHSLSRVGEPTTAMNTLVEEAMGACLMTSPPQVVLVITARFGRVMWKYEAMGYALILKHVGVLYQTLYLVATSMGLAACGLGGGNAETFAAASGLDFAAEGSVGEFVIGSCLPARSRGEDG